MFQNAETRAAPPPANPAALAPALGVAELEQVFIMGGVKTFQDTMPFVSDFHWFEIDVQEGDELTFPDFSNYQWNKVAEKRNKNTNWSFHHLIKAPQKLI